LVGRVSVERSIGGQHPGLVEGGPFRFGIAKCTLTDTGKAQIRIFVTNPATGSTYSR
jgi:hypothetical protein